MWWVLLLWLSAAARGQGSTQETLRFAQPGGCSSVEYYNIASLACHVCAANASLVPAPDGFSCKCDERSRVVNVEMDGSQAQCAACGAGEEAARGGAGCVPRRCIVRGGRSSYLLCSPQQISLTQNPDGSLLKEVKCVTCKPGYHPSPDRRTCQACSLVSLNKTNLCACDGKSEDALAGVCVPRSFAKMRDEYKPRTKSIWDHNSYRDVLVLEYLCVNGNSTACRALASHCVYSLYDADPSGPCRLWLKSSLPPGAPVLMYSENEAYSLLNQNTVAANYTLNSQHQRSTVRVALAVYADGGRAVTWRSDVGEWVVPCPALSDITFPLAHNYRHKCVVSARQLVTSRLRGVVAPYLLHAGPNASDVLTPIAVAIKVDNGDFVKSADNKNLKLYHRFFVVNTWSDVANVSERRTPAARCLLSATLRIKIEYGARDGSNKIYTPLLKLQYSSIEPEQVAADTKLELSFAVEYEMAGDSFVRGMEISAATLACLGVLCALLHAWSLSQRTACSLPVSALHFALLCAGYISNALYLTALGASLHSLLVFRYQRVVYTLPPTHQEQFFIEAFIFSAFALKLAHAAWLAGRQCRADVFLVDWLAPQPGGAETEAECCWRKLSVGQRWCHMQTERRVSPVVYVLLALFLLEVMQQRRDVDCPKSHEFAVAACALLASYAIVALVSRASRRCGAGGSGGGLLALCARANVSVLVFAEPLYAHCAHGRSVHNGEGAAGDTGATPGLPNQSFTIICDPNFRWIYSKLSSGVTSRPPPSVRLAGKADSTEALGGACAGVAREPGAHARALLNKFLVSFFDQALEGCGYTSRARGALARLLGVELPLAPPPGLSVLVTDAGADSHAYRQPTWWGIEWTLVTLELFMFSSVLWLASSHLLAGFIVLSVAKTMKWMRHYLGRSNLLLKTQLDPRLLR